MKKFFVSLVVVLAVFANQGQAYAQWYGGGLPFGTWLPCSNWASWLPWFGGYPWLTVPGCEAQMVVWGNQAMISSLAQRAVWPYPGWPGAPQQYQPPTPAFQVAGQHYLIVRVPKGWEERALKTGALAGVGAAIGGAVAKIARADVSDGVLLGLLGGGSTGLLLPEYDHYVVQVPPPQPQVSTQPQPPQLPSRQPQVPPEVPILRTPGEERLALSGAPMRIVNDSKFLVLVTAGGENVVFLQPRAGTPRNFRSPPGNMRFYIVNPNPQTGVMEGLEIEPESDSSLPGFRIPSEPKRKE